MRSRLITLGLSITSTFGCGSDDEPATSDVGRTDQTVTYYDDVVPILENKCLQCHRDGGIGPMRLDDYATAKSYAKAMRSATASRAMPPWGATSDGTCGSFTDDLSLSDAQIATISQWANSGAAEGKKRTITLPTVSALADSVPYATPTFAPEIQGGVLAEFDEYRCFELDPAITTPMFATGYQVEPGTPSIVHHVLAFVVDPVAAASDGSGLTNQQQIDALHATSPERDGWPCFGMAGTAVSVKSVPVSWAPGQNVVTYPGDSGILIKPTDRLVLQVHYNLADTQSRGKTDRTVVNLRLAAQVENIGVFALPDPFLRSLGNADGPVTLEPGQASTEYTWQLSVAQLGFGTSIPNDLQLRAVGPHMHQRGRKYRMSILDPAGVATCGVDVQAWDFHWQRLYTYEQPRPVTGDTSIRVTCDYDTSDTTEPVSPGWGTRNEMCLALLYFTAPLASFSAQ